LFKIEACEKINYRHIIDIPRINPPKLGGGLIFEHNPREIGSAFHRAGEDIGQNSHLWIDTKLFLGTFYLPSCLMKPKNEKYRR